MGLVNRLIELDALMAQTYEYVSMMTESVSPASLRETKWQIYTDLHRDVASSVKPAKTCCPHVKNE